VFTEKEDTMTLHKTRIALAAILVALAAVTAVDSASAQVSPFVSPSADDQRKQFISAVDSASAHHSDDILQPVVVLRGQGTLNLAKVASDNVGISRIEYFARSFDWDLGP
jgi:hypothetical protein